ncbi:MAG: hypothetical protein ACFBRM_03430 [Pikeienuella sp.]
MRLGATSGALSGLMSIAAILVSVGTLYLTELRGAEIAVLAADQTYLARDRNGSQEVVLVPLTLTNSGARDGAVRGLRLTVTDESGGSRSFRATGFGPSPGPDAAPFAPIAIPGRSSVSRAVLFHPMERGQPLLSEAGAYRLDLSLSLADGRMGDSVMLNQRLPYFSLPDLADGRLIRMVPVAAGAGGA